MADQSQFPIVDVTRLLVRMPAALAPGASVTACEYSTAPRYAGAGGTKKATEGTAPDMTLVADVDAPMYCLQPGAPRMPRSSGATATKPSRRRLSSATGGTPVSVCASVVPSCGTVPRSVSGVCSGSPVLNASCDERSMLPVSAATLPSEPGDQPTIAGC